MIRRLCSQPRALSSLDLTSSKTITSGRRPLSLAVGPERLPKDPPRTLGHCPVPQPQPPSSSVRGRSNLALTRPPTSVCPYGRSTRGTRSWRRWDLRVRIGRWRCSSLRCVSPHLFESVLRTFVFLNRIHPGHVPVETQTSIYIGCAPG